jgi:hypothetical protein
VTVGTCLLLAAGVTTASAEIVFLTSGRTLSIKDHRQEGDTIVLTMRAGGEVRCDKSIVDRIVDDEVPHPDPVPETGPQADQPRPDAASLLDSTPYGEIISAMSEANGVDPLLVRALIQVESKYNPRARVQAAESLRSQGEHRGGHQAVEVADRQVGRRARAGRVQRWRRGGCAVQRRASLS